MVDDANREKADLHKLFLCGDWVWPLLFHRTWFEVTWKGVSMYSRRVDGRSSFFLDCVGGISIVGYYFIAHVQ